MTPYSLIVTRYDHCPEIIFIELHGILLYVQMYLCRASDTFFSDYPACWDMHVPDDLCGVCALSDPGVSAKNGGDRDASKLEELKEAIKGVERQPEILVGEEGTIEVARHPEVDAVVTGIVGAPLLQLHAPLIVRLCTIMAQIAVTTGCLAILSRQGVKGSYFKSSDAQLCPGRSPPSCLVVSICVAIRKA